MFLEKKKKKRMSSGVVAISICCGIWEGENHVIDQIKTLYAKRYFKQAARTGISVLVLHWHALPTVNQNSTKKAKSGS